MSSIEDLKSLVTRRGGVARSNVFAVNIPAVSRISSSIDSRDLNILCSNVNLPGRQIMTNERLYGNKGLKLPYGFAQDDVSMTFYCLNDYAVKTFIEDWQAKIIDPNTYEVGYYKDYTFDINIKQLAPGINFTAVNELSYLDRILSNVLKTNIDIDINTQIIKPENIVYQVKLEDAYPTSMSQIDLSNEMDGLVQLNVQFSYKNWVRI